MLVMIKKFNREGAPMLQKREPSGEIKEVIPSRPAGKKGTARRRTYRATGETEVHANEFGLNQEVETEAPAPFLFRSSENENKEVA